MNRRQVLALLGSAAVGGCVGSRSDPGTTDETPTGTTNRTTTGKRTTTPGRTTTQTSPQAPTVGESLPSDCPVFDDDARRVVCHPVTDSPLVMKPSTESVSLPKASLTVTLANATDATFMTNVHGWRLHKRVDGEWYYVGPGLWIEPLYVLESGGSYAWNLTIDNTDLGSEIVTRSSSTSEDLTFRGLGGGTYAFGVSGWFEGQGYKTATEVVTRFEVSGDRLALSLTDSVESVERDGNSVVVQMPKGGGSRTVTVSRVSDPDGDPERVVAEQVLRTTPLRNALAAFEGGVETVTVENAADRAAAALSLGSLSYVEYRGTTYRVVA